MATSELIKKALEGATPAQLIRVRALIIKYYTNGFPWRFEEAIKAFDDKRYENKQIAYVLNDGELGEALRE